MLPCGFSRLDNPPGLRLPGVVHAPVRPVSAAILAGRRSKWTGRKPKTARLRTGLPTWS